MAANSPPIDGATDPRERMVQWRSTGAATVCGVHPSVDAAPGPTYARCEQSQTIEIRADQDNVSCKHLPARPTILVDEPELTIDFRSAPREASAISTHAERHPRIREFTAAMTTTFQPAVAIRAKRAGPNYSLSALWSPGMVRGLLPSLQRV